MGKHTALTDQSPMPFGKYKGVVMENVPASYLLWLHDEIRNQTMYEGSDKQRVAAYVANNMDVLYKELNNK